MHAGFDKAAHELLLSLGSRKPSPADLTLRGVYPDDNHVFDTVAGLMTVDPRGFFVSIRFHELRRVEEAKAAGLLLDPLNDLNGHSLKWNLQSWGPTVGVPDRLAELERRVRSVLVGKKREAPQ